MKKPIIGISMGDPAGIGPEIAAKALTRRDVRDICFPLVVGDYETMRRAAELSAPGLKVVKVDDPSEALGEDILPVFEFDGAGGEYSPGIVTKSSGEAAFRSVETLIKLAIDGRIDATVTGPINKEAINLAGHNFPGHTEIYAHYTGTKGFAMMLAAGKLRVIHNSTHVSLREACDRVKKSRVIETVQLAYSALKDMGIEAPRIAVAGLNPHAGEHGMFGREEIDEIIPAVEELKTGGINVSGPYPPDSIFARAAGGEFDMVVAMYHDQGHIPIKTSGFVLDPETGRMKSVSGVNITLGLPIIRVSVDHGTAFDIAWKNHADEMSLVDALEYAAAFSKKRA